MSTSLRYSVPLVLFPAGDIDEGAYEPLIRRLDPRRSYLDARRYDAELPEAAAKHAGELMADRRGPYRLAGWGEGGVLALETARQLVAAGEEVDLVVMVDSVPPGPQDSYEGRVVLYRADGRPGDDRSLGWFDSCTHLRIVRLDGEELSMDDEDQVAAVAKHLSGVLTECDREAALGG